MLNKCYWLMYLNIVNKGFIAIKSISAENESLIIKNNGSYWAKRRVGTSSSTYVTSLLEIQKHS